MYNVNLEIAAFLLSSLCLIYIMGSKKKQFRLSNINGNNFTDQHFIFINMLVSVIISSATSVSSYYLEDIVSQDVIVLQYLLHALYFFFHNFLPICFAQYVMNVSGTWKGLKSAFYILFTMPFTLCELMVMTNNFTRFVFYLDNDLVYHRGSLITISYAFGLFYYVIGFASFFRHQKAMSKSDRQTLGFILGLSAVGVILQGIRSDFAVELFAESLTLGGIMMMLEERSGNVDALTGVLNRNALMDDCRKLIENHKEFSIIIVNLTDLDMFSKLFNGRNIDSLLIQVSDWLKSISTEQDLYIYRSYDFAIVCHQTSDLETEYITESILNRFSKDWKTGGASFHLEALVSVLNSSDDISSLDELMEVLASTYIKTGLGSRLVSKDEFFSNQRNRKIEQSLRDAIEKKQLRVWYQPIWSVEEEKTIAAEALIRIDSDAFRGVSPAEYISIAEQSGIIRDIGLFVFEDVCRFLKSISDKDFGLSYIEINLSVHQFLYDDIAKHFEAIRQQYDIPAEKLNLEITESASIGDAPIVSQTMKALRSLGYTFSLDDFGTGYSNLAQFIGGHYKNIKIDKSLLWESDHNEKNAYLLDGLIRVIRSLGCNVVQEGVETAEQLSRTKKAGGNLIQGYFFSKPLPEDKFIDYLVDSIESEKEESEK